MATGVSNHGRRTRRCIITCAAERETVFDSVTIFRVSRTIKRTDRDVRGGRRRDSIVRASETKSTRRSRSEKITVKTYFRHRRVDRKIQKRTGLVVRRAVCVHRRRRIVWRRCFVLEVPYKCTVVATPDRVVAGRCSNGHYCFKRARNVVAICSNNYRHCSFVIVKQSIRRHRVGYKRRTRVLTVFESFDFEFDSIECPRRTNSNWTPNVVPFENRSHGFFYRSKQNTTPAPKAVSHNINIYVCLFFFNFAIQVGLFERID